MRDLIELLSRKGADIQMFLRENQRPISQEEAEEDCSGAVDFGTISILHTGLGSGFTFTATNGKCCRAGIDDDDEAYIVFS